jgi:hypothetical protein
MTGHQLHLPGFRLSKDGRRVVRDERRLNVSARLKAGDNQQWRAAARDGQRPPPPRKAP